jgi:hypothetical protein
MGQSSSLEVTQDFPLILCYPKVHYRLHNSLIILSLTKLSHSRQGLPSGLFLSGFQTKIF